MSEKALTNLSLLEPQPGPAGNAEVKAIYDSAETSKTIESAEDQLEQKTAEDLVKKTKKKKKKKKKGVHPRQNVKVNLSDCSYPVVSRVIKYLGWSKASNKENSSWDIYWKDNGSYSVSTVRQMCPRGSRRKLNHFGGMAEICLKHLLAHNMNRMKKEKWDGLTWRIRATKEGTFVLRIFSAILMSVLADNSWGPSILLWGLT